MGSCEGMEGVNAFDGQTHGVHLAEFTFLNGSKLHAVLTTGAQLGIQQSIHLHLRCSAIAKPTGSF